MRRPLFAVIVIGLIGACGAPSSTPPATLSASAPAPAPDAAVVQIATPAPTPASAPKPAPSFELIPSTPRPAPTGYQPPSREEERRDDEWMRAMTADADAEATLAKAEAADVEDELAIDTARDAVTHATSDAERKAAMAQLASAQHALPGLAAAVVTAKANAAEAKRVLDAKHKQRCADYPVGHAGC
jgi:hypothetical protein